MKDPRTFHIEILSPKQSVDDLDKALATFANKYEQAIAAGHIVCVPDNPMGNLAFQATELVQELKLPVKPGLLSVHINTFHTIENFNWILRTAADMGIDDVLAISGDGSERLPKLRGIDVGYDVESVTSVELVKYIKREFPGAFRVGVAYNPYEPQDHEWEKLERKLDAGAEYITTQPIVEDHAAMEQLLKLDVPVVVEAWMSKKLHLLSDCVGYEISPDTAYDPIANLTTLMNNYPNCSYYLAILGFKTQFPQLPEILGAND